MPWAVNGSEPHVLTALFTATSAVCVTGLVVVDTGTHWSAAGQMVIMTLFQIGGLGVMAFATSFALVLGRKIRLKHRLALQQSLDSPLGSVVDIFSHLLIFTLIMELTGTILLWIYWLPTLGWKQSLWYGLFHSISAFNNAGFDLFGNFSSLSSFTSDIPVNIIVSALFIIGSLGFLVNYELYYFRQNRRLSLHSRIVLTVTAILLAGGALLILLLEYNHTLQGLSPAAKVAASFFQSATRTAGFSTIDISSALMPAQILLMLLMFIGGSPGSTAGGIKVTVTTLAILIMTVRSVFRGRDDIELIERRIPTSDIFRALSVVIIAFLTVFILAFLLTLTQTASFMEILFESVSAVGTVGLSLGLTPHLNGTDQILVIIAMFLGRVGPLAMGFAIANRRSKSDFRYPEERIMIG